MDCFVVMDEPLRSAAVCAIDGGGRTVLERTVACEIDEISGLLANLPDCELKTGFEFGAMSQHLNCSSRCRQPTLTWFAWRHDK